MTYHHITCQLYTANDNPWKTMALELLEASRIHTNVVRLVFFACSTSAEEYLQQRTFLNEWVAANYASPRPLVSLVAQKPLVGHLIMELHQIKQRNHHSFTLTQKDTPWGHYLCISTADYVEIVVGGLCADNLELPVYQQSMQIFDQASHILCQEGMECEDIVRQWNYLEDITGVLHGNQCYQDFNDARSHFYGSSAWGNGYPAATGIGMQQGGVLIDFNAIKGAVCITPLDNDWQRAAHVYSDDVLICHRNDTGKGTPKFERGKSVADASSELIYISGTAAIRGEESIPATDVLVQTEVTLENIQHLIGLEEGWKHMPAHLGHLGLLRVYLKRPEDATVVKEELDKLCPGLPISYLYADICREELLVEIEGIAYF